MAAGNGIRVDVRGDFKSIDRDLNGPLQRIAKQAQSTAINKTATTIRSRGVKGIAKSARIVPQKLIRKRSRIFKASKWKLEAHIRIYTDPVPARAMKAKPVRKGGVKSSGKHFWPKGFAGTTRQGRNVGRLNFWQREGRESYPIKALRVPIGNKQGLLGRVGDRVMRSKFQKTLDHELQFRLKKYVIR